MAGRQDTGRQRLSESSGNQRLAKRVERVSRQDGVQSLVGRLSLVGATHGPAPRQNLRYWYWFEPNGTPSKKVYKFPS